MGLHRRDGHAGAGGDLGQVHLFDKTHKENAALLAGKFPQRFVDHLHSFSRDQLCFGRRSAACQMLAYLAGVNRTDRGRLPEAEFLALRMVAHQVERDPHQPGADAAIAAKLVPSQMSLEQAVLGNRLGRIPVCEEKATKRNTFGLYARTIKMDEDNPDYLVHEIFTQSFWKDHPLGKPILGTKDTVRKFERDPVRDFYKQRFAPGNMIISAAGHLKHEQFVDLVTEHFGHMKPVKNGFHSSPPKTAARIIMRNKKALEQVQICVGVPSHPIAHENRHASYILNTLLGGGMSSRLFQNIRERQGLAYAIYSDLSPYRDTGCLSVYAGTSRESAGKVVQSVVSEFRKLKANRFPKKNCAGRKTTERPPDAVARILQRAHVKNHWPGGRCTRPLLHFWTN